MRTSLLTFFAFVAACSAGLVPGKYVVELDGLQALNGAKRSFSSAHEVLYHAMNKRGVPFAVSKEFNTTSVFIGASLSLSPADIKTVANLPGVKAVRPLHSIPAPKPINARVAKKGDPTLPDGESTHVMTGVDKVHAQGITGKGIKIGIIDTGIDYTHPSLGDGFGPGHKVIGGYDFVGDAYDGTNTPHPDSDPLDQCNGHGTHVAGIIGANPGNELGISGVAYDASIASYRVFGCTGTVTEDVVIESLLRGYSDGMDILTLSLISAQGWTESSVGVVASRLVDKGTVITVAAGDDGELGSWYASSPGTGLDVISVASVDNLILPMQNATLNGVDHLPIPYLSALPLNVSGALPVYATSINTSNNTDACKPLSDSTPDLSDKLVVVRRGTCTLAQKLANIAAKGGKVTFIYNNVVVPDEINVGNYTAVLISPQDGAYLVNEFAAGANISVSFPQTGAAYSYHVPGGLQVSSFSTIGPTYDMNFKPALAAPGGNILSTLPLPLGEWGVASGTCMAASFAAASAALILQSKGRNAAKGIRNLLQGTAEPIASGGLTELMPLVIQGAGLLQADAAISTNTIVSPGQLTLNDTANFNAVQSFTITNTGRMSVTYNVSHVPTYDLLTVGIDASQSTNGLRVLVDDYASVNFSQSHVTVRPGGSAKILATFTEPTSVEYREWPVYSGYIQIDSGSETQRVSYLGLLGTLKDKQVVDNTTAFFGFRIPAIVDNSGSPHVNASYTLEGDDQPTLVYRLMFGSPLVRLDLVPNDFALPSKKRSSWSGSGSNSDSFGGVTTLGALEELDYIPRNAATTSVADNGWNEYYLNGTFADGSTIQDGQYKILLRALHITGDPNSLSDYETWISPTLTIMRS